MAKDKHSLDIGKNGPLIIIASFLFVVVVMVLYSEYEIIWIWLGLIPIIVIFLYGALLLVNNQEKSILELMKKGYTDDDIIQLLNKDGTNNTHEENVEFVRDIRKKYNSGEKII